MSSPTFSHGMILRAINPASKRIPTRPWPGSVASNPIRTFSFSVADSALRAFRNLPGLCFTSITRPATGACCTCTLKTERKIETRRHRPPMTSRSSISSMMSTLPWAGATTRPVPVGTCAVGSRKK